LPQHVLAPLDRLVTQASRVVLVRGDRKAILALLARRVQTVILEMRDRWDLKARKARQVKLARKARQVKLARKARQVKLARMDRKESLAHLVKMGTEVSEAWLGRQARKVQPVLLGVPAISSIHLISEISGTPSFL
jgi:cell division septal protein FtsQ